MTTVNAYSSTKKDHTENAHIIETLLRTVGSLCIPLSLSLVISIFATFALHANDGAHYFYNVWFFFCKLFFPSVPFMMWFIVRK